jgi:hypothetical protein
MGRLAWLPDVERHLGSYVYLLVDPRDGRIFYVGKGEGGRCFEHLAEARTTRADSRGDDTKLRTIREIEASGRAVRIDVLRHGPPRSCPATLFPPVRSVQDIVRRKVS